MIGYALCNINLSRNVLKTYQAVMRSIKIMIILILLRIKRHEKSNLFSFNCLECKDTYKGSFLFFLLNLYKTKLH